MDIILSNMDSTPIYEQITRQIKAKILGGELQSGEALPSMRLLAKELRISVITTKRAYEELEREGLITSQTGRGSFVAPVSSERLREAQLRTVEQHLTDAVQAARLAGLSADEFAELARTLFEESCKQKSIAETKKSPTNFARLKKGIAKQTGEKSPAGDKM